MADLEAQLTIVADKGAREVEMFAQQQDWQKKFFDNEMSKKNRAIAKLEHAIEQVQSALDEMNGQK